MYSIYEAVEKAKVYMRFNKDICFISNVLDCGDGYIICRERKDHMPVIGDAPVIVYKDSGKARIVPLTIEEEYHKFANAVPIDYKDE